MLASKSAPTAVNPGGAIVTTNSTTPYVTFVDTPVTQRIDQYQTTIFANLNGGPVFQQSFTVPFSDPAVQAAVAQAKAILTGDGATPGPVSLLSTMTSPGNSQLSYMTTGTSPTGAFIVSTTSAFGPQFVAVGDNQSQLFSILSGQLDINVNIENFLATNRNAITTNTFLTTQQYGIFGTTSGPIPSVPEPGTWSLMLSGLCAAGGLGCLRRRKG